MSTESIRYALIINSFLNTCPNYQLRAESEVAHCTSFLAMLRPLHSVTNKEQYKKLKYTRYRKYRWKVCTA